MKKYLMTAAAAIALCGTFTSCTHDDIVTGNGKIDVVENYEQAFLTRFGQPDVNQDWGFGKSTTTRVKTRAVSDYTGFKGDITPKEWYQDPNDNWAWKEKPYTFPSGPAESAYKSDITGITYEGDLINPYDSNKKVENYDQVYNQSNFPRAIWVDSNAPTMQFDNGNTQRGIEVYVVGEVAFSSVYLVSTSKLYLTRNSKLTLPGTDYSFGQADVEIYVAEGAELVCNGKLQFSDSKLFNNGTVTANQLDIAKTGQVYNGGKGVINIAGTVDVSNGTSVLVNDGTINVGSEENATKLEIAGSGRVQNNAEITVYGDTYVSSNDAMWVNNGHWTTTYYSYVAGSGNVINNCYLEVKEDFCINLGDSDKSKGFKMDSGAGVKTKNFYGGGTKDNKNASGPFHIYMGNNSVFEVEQTARMDASKDNYGFDGPASGDYAVLHATNIIKGHDNQGFEVTYDGNLAVVAGSHFAQGNDGDPSHPFISIKNNATIYGGGDMPDITINATPCNPGFNGGDDTRTDVAGIMIIAEDLTTGDKNVGSLDFDFNDVVFLVDYVDATTAKITLKAAGGTLPLVIGVPAGQEENESGQYHENEVHLRFGVSISTMVNTGTGSVSRPEPEPFYVTGNFTEENFAADCNNIRIAVKKNGEWVSLFAEKAKAASKMAVNQKFKWCDEREDIETKYSLFPNWVNDPSITWYW